MGLLRSLLSGKPDTLLEAATAAPQRGPAFDGLSIDNGVLYGVPPWATDPPRRVSRREAMSVPAVKRARDLICGSVGMLPLDLYGPNGRPAVDYSPSLFPQPEEGVAPSVTWTRVIEDLLFEGIAWLRVTHKGWHGRPARVVRLDPTSVTIQPDWRVYYSTTGNGVATEWLPDDQIIRIESPNDPLLVAGADAIRTCLAVAAATKNAAQGLPPMTYFTPSEGADPAEDEDVQDLLDAWQLARSKNSTAYVPAALQLHALGWNPEQLQLKDLRDQAVLEIARLTGVDAEELSVSTTSRTYANSRDRRRDFLDFTDGPYMTALTGRLSMDDVTPMGYTVAHDLTTFLSTDPKTEAEVDALNIASRVVTANEVRDRRGMDPLDDPATPEDESKHRPALPAPTPQEAQP